MFADRRPLWLRRVNGADDLTDDLLARDGPSHTGHTHFIRKAIVERAPNAAQMTRQL